MDTVRTGRKCYLHIIIHHKGYTAGVAERCQRAGFSQELRGGAVLVAQLHKSGPAVQRGRDGFQQGAPLQMAAVGHGIQPQLFGQNFHKKSLLGVVCYHYTPAKAKMQAALDNPGAKVYHTW